MLGTTHPSPHPLTSIMRGLRTERALESHLNLLKVCCGFVCVCVCVCVCVRMHVYTYVQYVSMYILVINVTAACDRGCTASVGLLVAKEETELKNRVRQTEMKTVDGEIGNYKGDVGGRGQS